MAYDSSIKRHEDGAHLVQARPTWGMLLRPCKHILCCFHSLNCAPASQGGPDIIIAAIILLASECCLLSDDRLQEPHQAGARSVRYLLNPPGPARGE